jgi:hypothetical protein
MRHYRSFVITAALVLPLCSSSFAQQCSLNTVRGTWAYQGHGTVMMSVPGNSAPVPVPFAALGVGPIDYQGRYTVHATIAIGGQVQDVDFSGSIQVNADCTATDTYTSGSGRGANRLVILDNGNEMRSMPTEFPMGPVAGVLYLRRLSRGEPQCTSDMVRGAYVASREGTFLMQVPGESQPVPTPFSAIVTAAVSWGGSGTAASTASMGGAIVNFEFPKVSIQVNSDCTATMNYTGVAKQFPGLTFEGRLKYVVLNNGDELIGMDTTTTGGFPLVLEDMKRISMMPFPPGQ